MKLVQLAQGFLHTKRCQTGCWVATPTLTHDLDHDFHDLQHNSQVRLEHRLSKNETVQFLGI